MTETVQVAIIAIPGIAALIVCMLWGPERAFLNVYLPVLLLLPQGYSWPISGEFGFASTAILPIGLFLLLRSKWHWNTIDYVVVAYMAITVVAEGMNKGYKLGSQNLALQECGSFLLPYIAAKQIFSHPKLAIAAAKRIAVSLAIVAIVSVYEFRMGSDLFTRLFFGVFPPLGNTIVIRAGFMRTQGPYGHAIALGIMMALGFRIARWLEWTGAWNGRMRFLPISKIRFCEFWIIAGSIMSISVGPWLAAACGSVIVSVCRARNRARAIVCIILIATLVGGPIYSAFKAFVSVNPSVAAASGNRLQEDAAYRNKLKPLYIPIVEERPTWGWGRLGFPVLEGMSSIDNEYLLTALTFGVYALLLRVGLFVWPAIRLAFFGFPLRRDDPGALTAFSMIGVYGLITVVANMTGLGASEGLFIIIVGWSSALLNSPASEAAMTEAMRSLPRNQFAFRRVMA